MNEKTIRCMEVGGTGRATGCPDAVRFTFALEYVADRYADAAARIAEMEEKLAQAFAQSGIAEENLKTERFFVEPFYENEQHGKEYKRVFRGYRCGETIVVLVDYGREKLARLLSLLSECGADAEYRLRFVLKDTSALKECALNAAVEDATRSARILAQAAGLSVTGVQAISYESSGGAAGGSEFRPAVRALSAANDFNPEDIVVEERVTMKFEISE